MEKRIKIGEGKSKIIYKSNDKIVLEYKGDVRCSTQETKYSKQIACLRLKICDKLFKIIKAEYPEYIPYYKIIDENTIEMENAEPLPYEWIPRFIAAGSVVKRFGFTYGYRFKKPVLKIDYKTDIDDYLINDDLILEKGDLNKDQLIYAKRLSLNVAELLMAKFKKVDMLLWDFKIRAYAR